MKNQRNKPSEDPVETPRPSCTVTVRMTPAERSAIHSKAAACGMTPSSYMRLRALDFKPRSALSEDETAALRNLDGCRSDIIRFANAMHAMTQEERARLFRSVPSMLDWYRVVADVTNRVIGFLNSVYDSVGRRSLKP